MRNRPLTLVVVSALILGSCGEGEVASSIQADLSAPTTTVVTSSTTVVTPSTTVVTSSTTGLPASVSYGPSTLVTGLEECELNPPIAAGTRTTGRDGTLHVRGFQMKCTVTNSDPRLAGTAYYTGNVDRWTSTGTDGVQVQWGTIRIENQGGAWDTEYIGIFSPETGDIGAELYTGSGDYEGLYYYQWVFGTFDQPWPTKGLIFPTTVPIP